MPISNAETERVFSFLWRVFAKDRQSFKNTGLKNILHLKFDQDMSPDRYDHAIDLFLTEHPNGELRKTPRRVSGYQSTGKRKVPRPSLDVTSPSQAIDLAVSSDDEENLDVGSISSDEWTDNSSESDF